MADRTTEFFEDLGKRRHEPRLGRATGKIRFDLREGGRMVRWLVTVRNGEVTVSRANRPADCVLRTDRTVFDRLVTGEANAMATILRGGLDAEGEPELLVLFQRLLPGPAKGTGARRAAGYARKQS